MSYWLGVHPQEVLSDSKADSSRIAWPAIWKTTVARIEPGDRIITYVTVLQRFHATHEVTGPPFSDPAYCLAGRPFAECVPVRGLSLRRPEDGVPVSAIRDDLEVFRNLTNPKDFSGLVRRSISQLDHTDGETILRALQGTP